MNYSSDKFLKKQSITLLSVVLFLLSMGNLGWMQTISRLIETAVSPLAAFAQSSSAESKEKFIAAALAQVGVTTSYDPAYRQISYPGGDVPVETGVCTDVVIRALRAVGIDLQRQVHEDMKGNFAAYPKLWKLTAPDRNIDHRRVANLMRFFEREKKSLPISATPASYLPGDIVAWRLPSGRLHLGILADKKTSDGKRFLLVHNISNGAELEDILFEFEIIGHYRYIR